MMTKKVAFGVAVLLAMSLAVMYVKYYVASLHQCVLQQEKSRDCLRNNIHLLSLEWAHLNTPQRLDALAKKFLPLTPLQTKQVKGRL